jgi:hypothetical protein
LPSLVRCNSSFGGLVLLEIALQLHGTVENADNVDFVGRGLNVHDTVVAPEEDPGGAT